MVEIEILEEGAKGLFGILGGKDAKVAVTLKPTPGLRRKGVFRRVVFQHGYEG